MSHDTNRPQFPGTRLRRLRSSAGIRDMVQETRLTVSDLIWPLFVVEGDKVEEPIASLPGVSRYSIDMIIEQARYALRLGIPAIALFPRTPDALKDAHGTEALNPNNLICRAVRAVKADRLDIL